MKHLLALAALAALATTAHADDRKYTLADLKALIEQKGYQEAIEHMKDIAPSERKAEWIDIAGTAGAGLITGAPDAEFHRVNQPLLRPGRGLSPPVRSFTDPGARLLSPTSVPQDIFRALCEMSHVCPDISRGDDPPYPPREQPGYLPGVRPPPGQPDRRVTARILLVASRAATL